MCSCSLPPPPPFPPFWVAPSPSSGLPGLRHPIAGNPWCYVGKSARERKLVHTHAGQVSLVFRPLLSLECGAGEGKGRRGRRNLLP